MNKIEVKNVIRVVEKKVGECFVFVAEKVISPVADCITAVSNKVKSACNWIKEKAVQAKNKVKNFLLIFKPAFS